MGSPFSSTWGVLINSALYSKKACSLIKSLTPVESFGFESFPAGVQKNCVGLPRLKLWKVKPTQELWREHRVGIIRCHAKHLNRIRRSALSGNVGYDKKIMTMRTALEELTEKAQRQSTEAAAQVKEATEAAVNTALRIAKVCLVRCKE
jgi:hypothetical protein